MKKTTRRKVLAFVLAFGMLFSTVFGTTPLGIFADSGDADVEQAAEVGEEETTDTAVEETTAATEMPTVVDTTEVLQTEETETATEAKPAEDAGLAEPVTEAEPEGTTAVESEITTEAVTETNDRLSDYTEEESEIPLTIFSAGNDGISSHADDDYKTGAVEITGVTMTVNGVDWNQVDVIRDGDRLRISFDWKLNNTDSTTTKFKINIQALATNIDIAELSTTTLMKGSTPIGTVRVEDGYIYLDITDQNFLADSERTGGGTIAGNIKVNGDPKTGDDVTIGIEDFTKDFTFDDGSPVSSMGIWKNTTGSIQYSNGKWYQEYSVMLRANNGTVSHVEIADMLGSGLSNLQDIKVTNSNVASVNTGAGFNSLDALSTAIGSMEKDEQITFTYKVEVSEEIFKTSWEKYQDAYNNTVSVTYQNNKLGDPETKTASAGMGVSVNTPTINKTGTLAEDQATATWKATWTVTINLNDYKQVSTDLKDIIQTIVDTPGNGLTLDGADLTLDSFTDMGNGIWQATYTTTVSEDKINSPNKEQLRNTVKMTDKNGYEWSGEGSVTTPGREWTVSKTDGTINSQTGEITWSVTVSDIPEGVTNFKIKENLLNQNWLGAIGREQGTHTMANANITIDGVSVVSGGQVLSGNAYVDGYTVITDTWQPGAEILLKDSLFTGADAKDSLTITYTSKITDTDYSTVEYQWKNTATVSYDYENVNTSRSDDGIAENEVQKQVLSKTGAVVYNDDKINYTLDVNLDNIVGLAAGSSLQIKDTLPDNMTLVAGTVKAAYYGKNAWNTWDITNASYLSGVNTAVTVSTSGTEPNITFSVTANQAMMDVIRLFHQNNGYDRPSPLIRLTYQAEVKDKEQFAKDGTTNFTNTASFTSGTYSCDPVSDEREMIPKKVVNKNGAYPVTVSKETTDASGNKFIYEIPVAVYTVDINPSKFTLGDGTTFTAVDSLGSAFNYDISSIEVTDADTGAKLTLGSDYKLSYSYQANSITFTLPDKRHLQITYEANCNLKKGEQLDASNSTNRFNILNQTSETMKDEKAFSTLAVESDFWADATTGSITLHKFWTDEDGKLLALKGSKFALYKATYDAAGNKMVLAAVADKTVEITDNTGDILVNGLALDQIYALVETEAPKGYLKGETYYFVITGSAGITLPSGMEIRTFQAGDTLYYENEKDQPAAYISKRELNGTAELIGATLAVKKADGTSLVQWVTTKDAKRIEVGNGDGQLVPNTEYTLEEISAPAGYILASPVKFTVDDEGKVTITDKGTDNTAVADEETLTMYDKKLELKLHKKNGGGAVLAGAVFELKQGNQVLATFTSKASAGANDINLMLDTSKIKADGTTVYTLTETEVPKNYKLLSEDITFTVSGEGKLTLKSPLNNPNITLTDNNTAFSIVNEQVMSVSGKKTWDDENNRDGKRPASVIIQLQRKLEVVQDDSTWEDVPGKTVTITDNKLTYTFTDLPVFVPEDYADVQYRHTPYSYRVVEKADPANTRGDFDAYVTTVDTPTRDADGNIQCDITNTYVSEKINVSVTKVWDDNNNQDNMRTNIWVQLYKNGTPLGERYLIEMDGSKGWIREWPGLVKYENGKEVVYTVDEVDAQGNKITPTGYTKVITSDTSTASGTETKTFTITNKHEAVKTSVEAEKIWNDNNNQDGARPVSVTVTLYADGISTGKTAVLNAAGSWKAQWTDLDAYKNGVAIAYSIVESAVADYTADYSPEYAYTTANPTGKLTVTNTHTAGKTSYTVRKAWSDNNDADRKRLTSVSVQLYADGVAVGDSVILNGANNWRHTWTNLDANNNGTAVVYSVQELDGTGTAVADGGSLNADYTVSYDTSVAGTTIITNTHQQELVEFKAVKVWNNTAGQTAIPASATVQLYADGKVLTGYDRVLNAAGSWQTTWENLPKYANGVEIQYSAREIYVPSGWSVSYSGVVNNTITITNTDSAAKLSVRKVWNDENNIYGRRPQYVRIQLMKNGVAEGDPVSLDDVNGWRYTWQNLQNGPTYTVKELDTDVLLGLNYNTATQGEPLVGATVMENGIPTIRVTNTYTVETTEIAVTKDWQDSNNQDGIRPASVTVALYADNELTGKTITLRAENQWTAKFTDLPVYHQGRIIRYSVAEVPVANYTASYSLQEYFAQKDQTGEITITNSHTPGKTSRTVKKIWNDNENQDGLRPNSIEVQLYANGVAKGDVQILTEANAWTYTWNDLDASADGTDIVYTVNEVNVPAGYVAAVVDDQTTGVTTITNSHGNNTGKLVITKTIKGDVTKEEAEGALRFKVTKPDGTSVEYTLKDFDSYDEATKTWTKTLDWLEAGNYTVEETVYTLDGRKVTVTYEVNGQGSQKGTQVTAGVAEGQTTKVDFKDVYKKKTTKLKITKTIKGDVTKEEAEGALTFEVKEVETGKTKTYTLKDFTYDAETGKYTLELNVVPGDYIITETTKDIDGYTCKVTYQINAGKKVEGDSASTTVEEGSVVTVAFEDTYKEEEDSTAESSNRKDKNPKTGDYTPIAACTMLMITAAGMAPLVAGYKKKKDEEDEEQ